MSEDEIMQLEYMKGWKEATDQVFDVLRNFGEAVCLLLDILPSHEVSLPVRISDECVLEFTVKKK